MRPAKLLLLTCVVMVALSGGARAATADPTTALLGAWQDSHADLLPPGVTHFEAMSSRIVFAPDGQFTLTVDKATGPLRESGSYAVRGGTLTLNFPLAPASYGFSRAGDRLTLNEPGKSPVVMRVL